jgi:hypothetical protein
MKKIAPKTRYSFAAKDERTRKALELISSKHQGNVSMAIRQAILDAADRIHQDESCKRMDAGKRLDLSKAGEVEL